MQMNASHLALPIDGVSRFKQFQTFLPFSRETWRKLVNAGKAPPAIKMGSRCTVWRNRDLHLWLADPAMYRTGGAQ